MEEKHNFHEPCSCNNSQSSPMPAPQKPCGVCRGSDGSCSCLPPKVVPVQADGCPILFRRVEIPASVGDETTNPPVAGKYRNVLLVYEATGSAFLYSSDGIPTQLPQKGDKGEQGEPGPAGPVGPAGPAGPQGEAGPQGIQGEQGPQGPKGEDGAGIEVTGSVSTYADLPSGLTTEDEGKGYYVEADGKLYIWNGTSFPANGDGVQIQGPQGPQGIQGIQGEQGPQGVQGPAGANGADGFSPTATVTPTDTGATISITDLNGTTTANITNGANGTNGQNGADGFSPIATVTQTSTGATISITDAQGTTTADITNGTGADVPIATTLVAGKVKPDGTTITVSDDGTISSAAEYILPAATDTILGGVRVGNNLTIDSNGTLSATAYTAGDGINITDGVISSTAKGGTIVYGGQVEHSGFVYLQFYRDSAKTDLITIDEMIGLLEAGSVVINTPLADSTTKNFYVVAYQSKETAGGTVLYFHTTEGSAISRYYTWSDADQFDGAKQNIYWLQNKLSAGSNISIQGDTISATDTTYSDFVGTDGTTAGTAGLVPAPTTSDAGKFLKADGTWDTAGEAANNINSTDWNALWQ